VKHLAHKPFYPKREKITNTMTLITGLWYFKRAVTPPPQDSEFRMKISCPHASDWFN